MLSMVTFTINILQMLAYIPYMDPMGIYIYYSIHIEIYQHGHRFGVYPIDWTGLPSPELP